MGNKKRDPLSAVNSPTTWVEPPWCLVNLFLQKENTIIHPSRAKRKSDAERIYKNVITRYGHNLIRVSVTTHFPEHDQIN